MNLKYKYLWGLTDICEQNFIAKVDFLNLFIKKYDNIIKISFVNLSWLKWYSYIKYKHTANGRNACYGNDYPKAYVEQVCFSDRYSSTSGSTFSYHGYTFSEGSVPSGYINFPKNNNTYSSFWTYYSKEILNGNHSETEACKQVCDIKY